MMSFFLIWAFLLVVYLMFKVGALTKRIEILEDGANQKAQQVGTPPTRVWAKSK